MLNKEMPDTIVVDDVLLKMLIVDNVFVKLMNFPNIGDKINGHSHTFDHITLLATGACVMTHRHSSGTTEKNNEAPHLIVTPRGIEHQFIATKPNTTMYCIHAIRDGDGVDDVAPQDISLDKAKELLSKFSVV
jgi:hypothetical protein